MQFGLRRALQMPTTPNEKVKSKAKADKCLWGRSLRCRSRRWPLGAQTARTPRHWSDNSLHELGWGQRQFPRRCPDVPL